MESISLDENWASTLTDEELEAIKEGEFDDDEKDVLKSIAGEDDNSGDDPAEDESGDEEEVDDPEADADGDGRRRPLTEESFRPSYQATLPDDFASQSDGIARESAELAIKFRDGEIDFDEYTVAMSEVTARRDALTAAKIKADIAVEMRSQEGEQRWRWTVDRFINRTASDEKIDYRQDAEKLKDLDLFVRALASDSTNSSQSAEWFLAEAHKRVKAMHGIVASPSSAAPAVKPSARKPNLSAAPKTLAHVPGSEGPGDIDSEFSDIYQLDGLDYETAIAKMSPAQRERFARVG